jgi:hypothetical protein
VRLVQQRVVGLAQELARSVEQALELRIEPCAHESTLTRRSRPG